jgi:hypothetical protein
MNIYFFQGDTITTREIYYVDQDGRLYHNIFSIELLNSIGLPYDKFHLAFETGYERNIYKNTWSRFSIRNESTQSIIYLKLRFYLHENEIQDDENPIPITQELNLILPRTEPSIDRFMFKISFLENLFLKIHHLAILNYIPTSSFDLSIITVNSSEMSWKNKPITLFLDKIQLLDKYIIEIAEIFKQCGKEHQLYNLV